MKITTWVNVEEDGPATIEVSLPTGLPKGRHRAIIEIDEATEPAQELIMPPTWNWTNWPADAPFSREDLYDDDGR
jgi:hypothetical protein